MGIGAKKNAFLKFDFHFVIHGEHSINGILKQVNNKNASAADISASGTLLSFIFYICLLKNPTIYLGESLAFIVLFLNHL